MTTLTPIRVRDCTCPDQPHDGHHIMVMPTISLEGGIEAERAMFEVASKDWPSDAARIQGLTYAWAPIFVRHGARDWDFCDEQGDPIPFDLDAVMNDYSLARLVADQCGELGYGTAILAPFQEKQAKPSRNGRTPVTTSARRRQTQKS